MPNPGKRKAQVNKLPHVRAARARACGSGAVAAAAASEGGMAEMDIEDALSLADEAQRQLEADAAEMNAEMMDAEGEGATAGGVAKSGSPQTRPCAARLRCTARALDSMNDNHDGRGTSRPRVATAPPCCHSMTR